MASLENLQVRKLLAKGVVQSVGTDQPVAIRVRHLGAETVTSVIVTAATGIVFTGSATTDTVVFATHTTLAKVVAFLNGTGRWEAKLLDGLSTQASDDFLLGETITSGFDGNGNIVWDVKQDTSVALEIGTCISAHRDFDVPMGRSRVALKEIVYSVNMGTAAVDSVQIYKRKLGNSVLSVGTESKVLGLLSVDTTVTTINWASGEGEITAGIDEEIFVRVKDAATLADAGGNYVQVAGVIE